MSKNYLFRTHFFQKSIKPTTDIDEDEDEDDKRRDLSGRKRVDVIECLLESSSDENDDTNINIQNSNNNILWLTFAEICHIRSVIAETNLSTHMFNKNKQYSKIFYDHLCFRCHKQINSLFFLPSFLGYSNSSICYVCQQKLCKKCSFANFLPPSSKHVFPVRLQTLIRSSTSLNQNETNKKNKLNLQTKTICYDCSQIFNEHKKSSQHRIKTPITELYPSSSLSSDFNIIQYTQHSHPFVYISNCKIEKNIIATSLITLF